MPIFVVFILLLIGFCIFGPLYLVYGAITAILSVPAGHVVTYILAVLIAFWLGRISVLAGG